MCLYLSKQVQLIDSSGGSWVTGSLFFNDWPLIHDLVLGDGSQDLNGWLLDFPFASPDGSNVFSNDNQYFYGSILWSVMAKANAAMYANNVLQLKQ